MTFQVGLSCLASARIWYCSTVLIYEATAIFEGYFQHMNSKIFRWVRGAVFLVGMCLLLWIIVALPVFSEREVTIRSDGNCHDPAETYDNWNPNADYPIEQLEELLSILGNQQDLNATIANIAILYDLKLYVIADKLEEKIPFNERLAFQEEQRNWIDSRRETLTEDNTGVNGTLAPFVTANSFIDLTQDRIALLETQLQSLRVEE